MQAGQRSKELKRGKRKGKIAVFREWMFGTCEEGWEEEELTKVFLPECQMLLSGKFPYAL